MTTIAWDGRYIAADRRASSGRGRLRETGKLHILSNGDVFAGCGDWCDVIAIRTWLDEVAAGRTPPFPKLEDERPGTIGLLWVAGERKMYTLEGAALIRFPVYESYATAGSGMDYATAAIALGKSAMDGFRLASRFDGWTGDVLDVFDTATGVLLERLEAETVKAE